MTWNRQRQTRTPCGGWGLDGIGPGVKPGQARAACRARRSGKEAQRLADYGKPGLGLPWRSSDLAVRMQHRLRLLERTWWRDHGVLRRRNNGALKGSRVEASNAVGTQSSEDGDVAAARTELQKARKAQSAARVEADAGAREELDADYVEYRSDRADRVGEALVGVSGRSADQAAGGGEVTSKAAEDPADHGRVAAAIAVAGAASAGSHPET